MYFNNYFFILFFLGFLIFFIIKILNRLEERSFFLKKEDSKEKWPESLKGFLNTFYKEKNKETPLLLTYNKGERESLKFNIKNIYLKGLGIIGSKKKELIEEALIFSPNLKKSIIKNLEKLEIVYVDKVEDMEIVEIVNNKMEVLIRSSLLGYEQKRLVDRLFFLIEGKTLIWDQIEVKFFKKEDFLMIINELKENGKKIEKGEFNV